MVTRPRTYLEHDVVIFDFKEFRHQCYDIWLRDGLTSSNWHRRIFVAIRLKVLCYELVTRHLAHGGYNTFIGDSTNNQLLGHHSHSSNNPFVLISIGRFHSDIVARKRYFLCKSTTIHSFDRSGTLTELCRKYSNVSSQLSVSIGRLVSTLGILMLRPLDIRVKCRYG